MRLLKQRMVPFMRSTWLVHIWSCVLACRASVCEQRLLSEPASRCENHRQGADRKLRHNPVINAAGKVLADRRRIRLEAVGANVEVAGAWQRPACE